MRVAANRLRAALRLFGDHRVREMQREVKRLQDALGEVRDGQVEIAWLEGQKHPGCGEAIRMLLAQQRAALLEKEAALEPEMKRWTARTAPEIERVLRRVGGDRRLGGGRMRSALKTQVQAVRKKLAASRNTWKPTALHKLRIEIKRLRYTAELLRPALEKQVATSLDRLPPVQSKLGDLHDEDVRLTLLDRFMRGSPREWQAELKRVIRQVKERRKRRLATVRRIFRRWERGDLLREWTKSF
jgi:CHAD domain-containing protein